MSKQPVDHAELWDLAELHVDPVTGRTWRIEVNGLRTSTRIGPADGAPVDRAAAETQRVQAQADLFVWTSAGLDLRRPQLRPARPPDPDVVLVLRPLPDDVPAVQRLRRALKYLLRACRLKLVRLEDVPAPAGDPQAAQAGPDAAVSGQAAATGNGAGQP